MKKIIGITLFIALVFFFILMLRTTIPYLSFRYDVDFLLTKQSILHVDIWRYSFYVHICTSLFALLFGGLQFSNWFLTNKPKVHRLLGKFYVYIVLLFSAPSGLIMGFYANGGNMAKLSFIITSLLWWIFTFLAFRNVLKRNFTAHRSNMFRSYALTLSAITLRTYVVLLPFLPFHLPAKDTYTLVAWLSWVPNLIIAEIIIRFVNPYKAVIKKMN